MWPCEATCRRQCWRTGPIRPGSTSLVVDGEDWLHGELVKPEFAPVGEELAQVQRSTA